MNSLTLNNKKGLTLIELLGVIVILGIIAAIAFPVIGNIIGNSRENGFRANVNNFIEAAITDAQRQKGLEGKDSPFVYEINGDSITFTYGPEEAKVSTVDYNLGFTKSLKISGTVTIDFDTNGRPIVSITEFSSTDDKLDFTFGTDDYNENSLNE